MDRDEMPTPDEAFDRLKAADPGAAAEPRLGVLRAKVEAQVDSWVPDAAVADELAARREAPRRRRRGLLVAAAVAGAVAVGGGGYVVGAMGGAGAADSAAVSDTAGFARPGEAQAPVTVDGSGPARGGDAGAGATTGGPAGAVPEVAAADSSAGSMAIDRTWPGGSFGRTTFQAQGLSEQGGTAQSYAFDARAVVNAETAARVAGAFGVPGEVREDAWQFVVGAQDGSGPQVTLGRDGTASFGYSNYSIDPWQCKEANADGSCPTPPATTVDDTAAATALADAMRSLGVDPATFEVTVTPVGEGNEAARWVTARRVVGGTLTTDTWSATVTDAGLVNLNGTLAAVVELGSYDVVSPAEAVRRLGDPRFGSSSMVALAAGAEARSEAAAPDGPGPVPAPPAAGGRIAWPVTDVTITGARLALTQQWTDTGAVLFVPAYELSDAEGNTWSVIAVTDDALDYAAR